jgi:hypothetical protein
MPPAVLGLAYTACLPRGDVGFPIMALLFQFLLTGPNIGDVINI